MHRGHYECKHFVKPTETHHATTDIPIGDIMLFVWHSNQYKCLLRGDAARESHYTHRARSAVPVTVACCGYGT